MKKILFAVSFITALALSPLATAHQVTFTTRVAQYDGYGTYLAMYLTDANGRYQQTLWIAGEHTRYYSYLRGWARGSHMSRSSYDGLTGASVAGGHTLKVTLNVDDRLINHGYKVVIDTAVEGMGSNRADVVLPLTTADSGKSVSGRGYIRSFNFKL